MIFAYSAMVNFSMKAIAITKMESISKASLHLFCLTQERTFYALRPIKITTNKVQHHFDIRLYKVKRKANLSL